MRVSRSAFRTCCILLALCFHIQSASAQNFILDQWNDRSVPQPEILIHPYVRLGQTFVPQFDQIEFAEFWVLRNSPGPALQLQVLLRAAGRGEVLGQSTQEPITSLTGAPVQVTFSPPVPLVPGQEYMLELVPHGETTASMRVIDEGDDSYPRGRLMRNGQVLEGDAWFREGILEPLPVLEMSWGSVKSVYR